LKNGPLEFKNGVLWMPKEQNEIAFAVKNETNPRTLYEPDETPGFVIYYLAVVARSLPALNVELRTSGSKVITMNLLLAGLLVRRSKYF
jgi:hypothetical protein